MKRLLSLLCLCAAILTTYHGVGDFKAAQTGVELFKAIVWIAVGCITSVAFWENVKSNEWPWQ